MTAAALPIAYDPEPDSLSGRPTLFQLHEQTLLDLAAISQLTEETPASRVSETVANLAALHDTELVKNLETRAALLDSEATFVEEDLRERAALVPDLKARYTRRAELRDTQVSLNEQIVRAQVELLARRQKAEEERLELELERVRSEEASLRAQNDSDTGLDDQPNSRQQRVAQLQQRREEILKTEASAFEREEYLRQRWITRTVAGFLLWLGYASVVATGSVLALIMSGRRAFDLRPLVAGTRAIVASIFPTFPAWFRLSVTIIYVAFLLAAIIGVFIACDAILRKRWKWDAEKKSRPDASAQMTPQALTPRTYARFVALLPFTFLGAILLVVLTIAPTFGLRSGDDASVLMSIFPSVGYSFIGITIAFLATGVFMMYFIRVIEPRSTQGAVLRHSWEFAIPPLLLVTALAVAPYQLSISAGAWLPWAAFMLMSSLALASGLVFYGIFKDARRARERVVRIEKRLQRLTGVPADDDEDTEEERTPLASERDWLQRVLRRVRFGRVPRSAQEAHQPPDPNASQDLLAPPPPIPITILVPDYRAIDMVVAPELVMAIEQHRGALRRIDADLHETQAAIAQLEPLVAPETMSKLRERRLLLQGMKLALATHQEERRQHARIDQELLLLKIATTQSATQAVAPLIAAVRHPLAPGPAEGATQ
jgi:hypothetical protein